MKALAPGCDPLLQGLARSDPRRYQAQLTHLLEGPFELDALQAWIDARVAQLTPLVAEDSRGPGLIAFRTNVEALRGDLALLALRLRAERDGEPPERQRLEVDALNDFETATPIAIKLGVSGLCALDSNFEIDVGRGPALGGERDLELGLEFRDALEAPSHWVRFSLPFNTTAGVDLNRKSALRLVLQADAPRMIRISIMSSNYSVAPTSTSATLGWDVPVDGTRQEIELPLSSAAFPAWSAPLPDVPSEVFSYSVALVIDPLVKGLRADGYLGAGVTDRGRLRIDEVQFLP